MMPLASPGIPSTSEKLFELKYLSQEAFSSGLVQNNFQMLVVFFTTGGGRLGSKVGPTVLLSNRYHDVKENKQVGHAVSEYLRSWRVSEYTRSYREEL